MTERGYTDAFGVVLNTHGSDQCGDASKVCVPSECTPTSTLADDTVQSGAVQALSVRLRGVALLRCSVQGSHRAAVDVHERISHEWHDERSRQKSIQVWVGTGPFQVRQQQLVRSAVPLVARCDCLSVCAAMGRMESKYCKDKAPSCTAGLNYNPRLNVCADSASGDSRLFESP